MGKKKNTIQFIRVHCTVLTLYITNHNFLELSLWNELNRQKKVVAQEDQTCSNEAGVFEFEISKNCTTSE